jgi:tetratricopeptide (TPR) repeat protein
MLRTLAGLIGAFIMTLLKHLLFLFAVALASPSFAREEDPVSVDLNTAASLAQKGDSQSAVTILDKVIGDIENRHRGSKKAYYCADGQAQVLMVLLKAASKKQDAEITNRQWCEALFLKGYALVSLKRTEEAGAALSKAAEMAPLNMQYANEYAEWHKSTGQWQKSLDLFRQAITLVEFAPPNYVNILHARALRGVGFNLIELKKLDEAEVAFQESLKFAPGNQMALGELDCIKKLRGK